MKHISLDREDKLIQQFIRGLPVDAEGSLLELGGQPLVRVLPPETMTDRERLKDAILRRRDESRAANADWNDVDQEIWNGPRN